MEDTPPQQSMTILVVEDEQDLADLYAAWLADENDVTTVYSGTEALEVIDASVDIVLLDRRMPDVSGDDVLEHITDTYPNIQVAMISGISPEFAILGYGIEHYLVKPITRDDLRELITEMTTRQSYSEPKHQLEQLRSRKAALEQYRSTDALQGHPEYTELLADIDELEATLDTD